MTQSPLLSQLGFGLVSLYARQSIEHTRTTPGLHHSLAIPIRERLILVATSGGADERTVRRAIRVSEDATTLINQSGSAFPPVTIESMLEAIKELEPLFKRAEESRRKLEEMGLRYDPFTEQLSVVDPYKLPDDVRREWLRQMDERFPWPQPKWNLEACED